MFLRFLFAYHLVWQEYYRNPRVQRPCFVKDIGTISPTTAVAGRRLFSAPFHFFMIVLPIQIVLVLLLLVLLTILSLSLPRVSFSLMAIIFSCFGKGILALTTSLLLVSLLSKVTL